MLSWVSFWINHEATSARVALGEFFYQPFGSTAHLPIWVKVQKNFFGQIRKILVTLRYFYGVIIHSKKEPNDFFCSKHQHFFSHKLLKI